MNFLVISIIESVYIFYMYNLFKTKLYIHHPLEIWLQEKKLGNWVKHPVSSDEYGSKICPLGNMVGILLPIWLVIRYIYRKNKSISTYNQLIWKIVFIVSLILNMNAFVYLLPIYLIEYLYVKNYLN